jgi:hypothetical protein
VGGGTLYLEKIKEKYRFNEMIYAFCDEDIKDNGTNYSIRYAVVFFNQDTYNREYLNIERIMNSGKSLSNPILDILSKINGISVISHGSFPVSLVPSVREYQIGNEPEIPPRNLVWIISMSYTIAVSIKRILDRGWGFKTCDIFYDTKDLSQVHRNMMNEAIREKLKSSAVEFLKSQGYQKKIIFRRINEVEKRKPGSQFNKFQLGTWLADKIVRKFYKFSNKNDTELIEIHDITKAIIHILNSARYEEGFI